MPNHFHIYIFTPRLDQVKAEVKTESDENKFAISIFLEKLGKAYAQYFNTKYKRTGGLFEGKFKATHIKTDSQAKYNFSYIHLNPIKLIDSKWRENGIKNFQESIKFLENYRWSSYIDYKGILRSENKILDRNHFLQYFKDIKDFDDEILEWLKLP